MWTCHRREVLSTQILSSRKTRIKTPLKLCPIPRHKRTQILSSRKTRIKTLIENQISFHNDKLRYYPPEKQGLRRPHCGGFIDGLPPQILSSRKTRIKTGQCDECRLTRTSAQILSSRKTRIKTLAFGIEGRFRLRSDTILQKNKD